MEKVIQNLIKYVRSTPSAQYGEETLDLMALFKDGKDIDDCRESYKKRFDIAIPLWNNSADYLEIVGAEENILELLEKNESDMIRILQFIDQSKEQVIAALQKDNADEMAGFCPSKVVCVSFDYSGESPEYSFYVESNEDYEYHVFIRSDMTFDASSIS